MIDITRALAVPGWMSAEELHWLAVRAYHAARIVEVGSWKGRSTRALADHTSGVVYAVDPWRGPYLGEDGKPTTLNMNVYPHFQRALKDHLLSRRVVAVRAPSHLALPRLARRLGRTVDFLFIDGDHRTAVLQADIAYARMLVRPGGVLAGHDYDCPDWPAVAPAVREALGFAPQVAGTIWWTEVAA